MLSGMRVVILILLIARGALAQAPADPEPPSTRPQSPTLGRAIKLYDKQDFWSATIELQKVLDGESGDDTASKQRAEFFQAKCFFQLKFYAASFGAFAKIVHTGAAHTYYQATLKWLAALGRVLGFGPAEALIGSYDRAAFADASLASVKDELWLGAGADALANGKLDRAIGDLTKVASSSTVYSAAQRALGFAYAQKHDDAKAIAAWANATGDLAALATGQAHLRAKAWDKAIAAYGKVSPSGTLGPRAAWEASLARLRKKLDGKLTTMVAPTVTSFMGAEPVTVFGLVTADFCAGARAATSDPLKDLRADAHALAEEIGHVLAVYDDNDDLFERGAIPLRKGAATNVSRRLQAVGGAALSGPAMSAQVARVDELALELDQFRQSDRAWQTTKVAADILADLTVQLAVARSAAGKLAREELGRIAAELDPIARGTTSLPVVLAGSSDAGLAVTCP